MEHYLNKKFQLTIFSMNKRNYILLVELSYIAYDILSMANNMERIYNIIKVDR